VISHEIRGGVEVDVDVDVDRATEPMVGSRDPEAMSVVRGAGKFTADVGSGPHHPRVGLR